MPWTCQRLSRAKGFYYSAVFHSAVAPPRSVTIGYMPVDAATANLSARLRRLDADGQGTDALVVDLCCAPDENAAQSAIHRHQAIRTRAVGDAAAEDAKQSTAQTRHVGGHVLRPPAVTPVTTPVGERREPLDPKGGMTLEAYVKYVWTPLRSKQPETWKREIWWWDMRILPVLGEVRLCDLDARKWSEFLLTLNVGGRTKAIAQTCYRTALTYATDVLEWIDRCHRFARIKGSTKSTRAVPEPLTIEEVATFLDFAPSRAHRALFGVQIGQGLRPGEVIRVRWEDVDFKARTLVVRGTKNALAATKIGLTPLSERELLALWTTLGCPAAGVAFERSRGGGAFPVYPRSAFTTTARRSGLNAARGRALFPYICRHSFATIAAVAGIDRVFTKDMMRHSRKSTLLEDAYERVSKTQTAAAFSGFGRAVVP